MEELLPFNYTGGERDEERRGIFEYSGESSLGISIPIISQSTPLISNRYIYMYIRNVGTRQRFVCTMILILCTCYFVLFNTSITLTCQFRFRKFPNIIVYFRRREEKFCSLSLRFCSSWSYDEFFFVWCIQRLLTLLWKFVWDIFEFSTLSYFISEISYTKFPIDLIEQFLEIVILLTWCCIYFVSSCYILL